MVKIGGKRGNAFIFIGPVTDDTIREIDILGEEFMIKLRNRLDRISYELENWDEVAVPQYWVQENQYYKSTMSTYTKNLNLRKKKLKEIKKACGKDSKKYKRELEYMNNLIARIRGRAKQHRTFDLYIFERKKYYENSRDLIEQQLKENATLTDFEIIEDYMSIDDETYGGRILLVDTWLNGKYWSLHEYQNRAYPTRSVSARKKQQA